MGAIVARSEELEGARGGRVNDERKERRIQDGEREENKESLTSGGAFKFVASLFQ